VAEYCTVDEVGEIGIKADALADIDPDKISQEVRAASDFIDGYLRSRFELPLIAWGDDIRKCCAVVSGWNALTVEGVSPDGDSAAAKMYDFWIAWLKDVSKGATTPSVTDSTPTAVVGVPSGGPRIVSATSRGYSPRGTGRVGHGPFTGDT